jgi:hypothetical protein
VTLDFNSEGRTLSVWVNDRAYMSAVAVHFMESIVNMDMGFLIQIDTAGDEVSGLQVQSLAQIHTFTNLCLPLSTLGSHPPSYIRWIPIHKVGVASASEGRCGGWSPTMVIKGLKVPTLKGRSGTGDKGRGGTNDKGRSGSLPPATAVHAATAARQSTAVVHTEGPAVHTEGPAVHTEGPAVHTEGPPYGANKLTIATAASQNHARVLKEFLECHSYLQHSPYKVSRVPSVASAESAVDPCITWLALTCCHHFVRLDPICLQDGGV